MGTGRHCRKAYSRSTKEAPFTFAQPVSLRGEKIGKKIAISGGAFSIDVPAYTPVSIVLN
jgi:hypothetical protein